MELCLKNITKEYKDITAVNDVNYTFTNGVYALLGANGSGKSTLMRMICGVLQPNNGEITFDGIDVLKEEYRDILGYLPQDFGYYPNFTAMEFLLYIASLKGIPKDRAKQKANELLETVSLTKWKKKKIKKFSGGMRQRLGIAQAMLNNPKILILDEPTAGLDPKERVRFRNLISSLGKDRIVLLSTHIVSDIEHIANQIIVMKNGEFIQKGTLEQLKKSTGLVDSTLEDLYLYYFSEV
ncbi:MAG: ABC transporter ATP-binding protein [Clostridia bacterium]